jgi:hypothetical protein
MPSSRRTTNPKRKMFLNLSGQIESQLREAYGRKFQAGAANQTSLAKKIGIGRSTVHRRLMGHTNMTTESIADMVWALDHAIKVEIYDPQLVHGLNYMVQSEPPAARPVPPAAAPPAHASASAIDHLLEALRKQAGSQTPIPA